MEKHVDHVNGSYVRENDYSNSNGGHMTCGMSSMIVLFQHSPNHLPISSTTEICVVVLTVIVTYSGAARSDPFSLCSNKFDTTKPD